jgi:hypothetical protein
MPSIADDFELWWVALSLKLRLRNLQLYCIRAGRGESRWLRQQIEQRLQSRGHWAGWLSRADAQPISIQEPGIYSLEPLGLGIGQLERGAAAWMKRQGQQLQASAASRPAAAEQER